MHRLILSLILACAAASPAFAWGKTGHRVVAEIADRYLTDEAAAAVKDILGPEGMAEAADWPDFMRSDPSDFWRSEANPWHYVTVPEGQHYHEVGAPPEGDAMTALAKFRAIAADPAASLEDRQLALRFIIHIVGDLHQPLHAGNGKDRGGNFFTCYFFDKLTNLHAVWDEDLINYEELSYTEWTDWLTSKITTEDLLVWSVAQPEQWIDESAALRDTIYPDHQILKWEYIYATRAPLRQQLSKGGVRLAAYLNDMFACAEEVAPEAACAN
ncbi:MAG: S1/P1 nuclease [Hyphomonas sp.]|uniref:S1/P1 nuclease n=1 Tax=Hyphomonas sp. TaxID=87 RepID=UPI003527A4B3